MSLDNVIYVGKKGGRYYVWEDTLSNSNPQPQGIGLQNEFYALEIAAMRFKGSSMGVEGGIQLIDFDKEQANVELQSHNFTGTFIP